MVEKSTSKAKKRCYSGEEPPIKKPKKRQKIVLKKKSS